MSEPHSRADTNDPTSEPPRADRPAPAEAEIPLERDLFLRSLVRELAGTLEDVVGLEEASGFVSLVGQQIGDWINRQYLDALDLESLDRAQVAEVLVDLKRRIQGDFYIIEHDEEKIVFGNRACPFGDRVIGRPSMCMMTSNVFGGISAEHLGYARVELAETIAGGAPGCRVVVHLKPPAAGRPGVGREYYKR